MPCMSFPYFPCTLKMFYNEHKFVHCHNFYLHEIRWLACIVNLPSFDKEILQLPKQVSDPLPSDKQMAVTLEEQFSVCVQVRDAAK